MATVKIQAVEKDYGSQQVMHGVDVDIEDGEFVVLVGPSGCGKSTLLRMVAGLEEISAGSVSIDGIRVNDLPPKKRDLAMVFQSYALYPHMTVSQNMGFSLRLAKRPKAEIEQEVGRAADILGLTDYLERFPRHLSGGQRQRVAMGRAIVRNPKVFLFDEPLSNLDAKLRAQMRSEIKLLHTRLGTTTLYVTHDQTEAMTMADKIVVLRDGRVEQIGAPQDLYNEPANAFVAGFIGSPAMNFLNGIAARHALARINDGMRSPDEVILGVRPKHFSIEQSEGDVGFEMTVDVVERTGDEMEVRGRIADGIVTVVVPNGDITSGQVLTVYVSPGRFHVFEAANGQKRIG